MRSGYLEGVGGYSWLSGPFARAELGVRPHEDVRAFLFGEWNQTEPMVGVGAKWEFDW